MRLSSRYPTPPPIPTLATNRIGNSIIAETCRADSPGRLRGGFEEGEAGTSVPTETRREEQRISCQAHERLRVNARSNSHKAQHGEDEFLPDGDDRQRRVAWLLQIRVHHNTEVVVQRGNDVQRAKKGKFGVAGLNQRL